MRVSTTLSALVLAALAGFLSQCTSPTSTAGNGSDVGNAHVMGYIRNADGSPAKNAVVRFITVDHNPRAGLAKRAAVVDSTVTNDSGQYTLDSLAGGDYNVLASGDSGLSYQDSVTVLDDTTNQVPDDTLKAPGSLRGVVRLQPGDDARKVFLIALGTNSFASPGDSAGNFALPDMAEGRYSVRILSILDDYGVLDTSFAVRAGVEDTLADTIVLPYTGIPVPQGLTINYDTLKQIVHLSWNVPTTGRTVQGYNVYRKHADSTSFAKIAGVIADTFYMDSSAVQDQTYEYKVAAVDLQDNEGTRSTSESIEIANGFALKGTIGEQGSGQDQYSLPSGIAILDSATVLVADYDSGKILTYDTSGAFLQSFDGFDAPSNVVAGGAGRFYVVEKNTHIIKYVDAAGEVLSQFGGSGMQDGQFADISPRFFVSVADELYIPDYGSDRVQVFDSIGTYLRELSITAPWSIAFLAPDVLAVGSDLTLTILSTDGDVRAEWPGVYSFTSTATQNGNLAIATRDNEAGRDVVKVKFYSPEGALLGAFGVGDKTSEYFLGQITGLAVDSHNNLYVTDSGTKQIKVFSLPSTL